MQAQSLSYLLIVPSLGILRVKQWLLEMQKMENDQAIKAYLTRVGSWPPGPQIRVLACPLSHLYLANCWCRQLLTALRGQLV